MQSVPDTKERITCMKTENVLKTNNPQQKPSTISRCKDIENKNRNEKVIDWEGEMKKGFKKRVKYKEIGTMKVNAIKDSYGQPSPE